MTHRTPLLLSIISLTIIQSSCGGAKHSKVAPVVYENPVQVVKLEIASTATEPVSFAKGNLKVLREEVPMSQVLPDDSRNMQRNTANCGTPITEERMTTLRQKYSDVSAWAYGFYPTNPASDISLYYVIAVPNLAGYTDKKTVGEDFTDSCVAGSMPLVTMNAQWLVFAGPSCDLSDARCKGVANLVRPSIKLNAAATSSSSSVKTGKKK